MEDTNFYINLLLILNIITSLVLGWLVERVSRLWRVIQAFQEAAKIATLHAIEAAELKRKLDSLSRTCPTGDKKHD